MSPTEEGRAAGRPPADGRRADSPTPARAHAPVTDDGEEAVAHPPARSAEATPPRLELDTLRLQSVLLDSVEQAVIASDLTGRIIYWNRHAEKLYGWTAAEALGRNIIDVTPAEEAFEQAAEIMARLFAGESWSGEFNVRRRDGTTFPAMVTDTPILDGGRLVGVVGISTDITERRRAEEALRDAEHRAVRQYEALIRKLTLLAEALGTARELVAVFRELKDFAAASVPCIGIFISLYDPERDVRTAVYAWGDDVEVDVSSLPPMPVTAEGPNSRAVRTGQVVITNDYWNTKQKGAGQLGILVGPDNQLRPQSSLVVPMRTMGRTVGTVEVQSYEDRAYRDEHVTAMRMAANLAAVAIENVRLLDDESHARREAEESNRLKDEFLATISHELRTPLTAILGWSSMLREGRLGAKESASAVEVIERNARTQQQIVDDILDVSRIITGKLRVEPLPVELTGVVQAAIDSVRPAATAKNIELSTRFDPRVREVSGDADRLQQVLWNLLSNAVKFTPVGGSVRVRVERAEEGAHARVCVEDTGIGIRHDFLPYVFDRFRQADQSTTRAYGGIGLGLAIVRHLVELHGGTVGVVSEGEGRGACFTVELPLAELRGADARERVGGTSESEQAAMRGRQSEILKGLRVLVVDDEADTLDLVEAILRRGGAEVERALGVDEALGKFSAARPDALISDIGMPTRDGYDLIRAVRELDAERGGRPTPAVALTAYAGDADRRQALDAGYRMHIAKPVDPARLVEVLAEAVGDEARTDGRK
ncbi:MAG TPA: ATP-binding protein [Pyrinomonadaceae bacterium]|nr:ATP-binding protein [Pyrinomonadaceae bacterium]